MSPLLVKAGAVTGFIVATPFDDVAIAAGVGWLAKRKARQMRQNRIQLRPSLRMTSAVPSLEAGNDDNENIEVMLDEGLKVIMQSGALKKDGTLDKREFRKYLLKSLGNDKTRVQQFDDYMSQQKTDVDILEFCSVVPFQELKRQRVLVHAKQ